MLEAILEFLVELILDTLLQALFELAWELGLESVRSALRPQRRAHPAFAAIGFLLIGSVCGIVSAWALPRPLVTQGPLPGLSLVLSPVISGIVMHSYGTWAEQRGRQPSFLATFWGGSGVAFAFAVSRRIVLQRWAHAV